ncbi:MAG: transcriptional regulator, TetR family [Labilithrix sp.]|nr:transcriptional regulator, TetR family [Labilithrix sp.]
MRDLFVELARDSGADDSERLGRQLGLLYDGAIVGASMERDPSIATEARAMAELLVDRHGLDAGKSKRTKRPR